MSSNVTNQVAYLRTSRNFNEDLNQLTVEINKTYLDIAAAVNERIIGLYPVNKPAITGETFFNGANQKQQTLRQIYLFTSTSSIVHGINVTNTNQFTECYGSYTNGTNSYGLLWATNQNVTGQISFYITSTEIVFVVDSEAPSLTSGRIVLTWLSQP